MKIKLCGLFRECDADYVNAAKPDYAGFVFFEKSHRNVSVSTAKKLRTLINPEIATVGVFVDADIDFIVNLLEQGVINIVQLHGSETEEYIAKLREVSNGAEIWKAFKISSENDVEIAKISTADKIVLDNGYGTGICFDWCCIGKISRPFILAGGLTPENIAESAKTINPYAVDLSSGIETNRVKDKIKMIAAVKSAHL